MPGGDSMAAREASMADFVWESGAIMMLEEAQVEREDPNGAIREIGVGRFQLGRSSKGIGESRWKWRWRWVEDPRKLGWPRLTALDIL